MPLHHLCIYVADIEKSKAFYVDALKPLNWTVISEFPGVVGLGENGAAELWLIKKKSEDTVSTHAHFAFRAATHAKVNEWYEAAIKAGGTDNGKPGPRPQYGPKFYGAFVRDPDGYNIEACDTEHMGNE